MRCPTYLLVAGVLLAGLLTVPHAQAQTAPSSAASVPIELTPYRVRVAVAFAADQRITVAFRRQTLEQLAAAIERSTGGQWKLQVAEAERIAPANRMGLERLTGKDFALPAIEDPGQADDHEQKTPPKAEFDKQFLLTVQMAGAKYLAAGREWDDLTQELGPILEETTWERRAVPEILFRVVSRAFHPLLVLEETDVEQKTVQLKLRAGGLIPEEVANDPTAETLRVQIRPGTTLVSFFRYHNKEGSLREIQFLPWTYLVVRTVERGRVMAELVTGIRTPLGAKRSKRVQVHAVAKRPLHPSTTLQIRLRQNPRKHLAGHYVTATAEKHPNEEDKADAKTAELFQRLTDRQGRLEIPAVPGQEIVWLRVRSGKALLALVPFAAGLEREVILDLPDDSIRLGVEGDVAQVRARLVDTVAQRAALLIRARKQAGQQQWAKVDEELAKLDALPSLQDFRDSITTIRVPAQERARQQNSRLTERQVGKLCDEASALVEKYLTAERVNLVKEEIQELRRAAGN